MILTLNHYGLISELFRYPGPSLACSLSSLELLLQNRYPDASGSFLSFCTEFLERNEREREEYFVRTFEVEALCCLDAGFVLFGEDYKRGDFLARMQQEQNKTANDLGAELADHLPNILTLLPKLTDMELAAELCWCLLIPAVKEMKQKLQGTGNYYAHAFELLLHVLNKDFHDLPFDQYVIRHEETLFEGAEAYACGNDFLKAMGKPKF